MAKIDDSIFISIPKTGTNSIRDSLGMKVQFNHLSALRVKQEIGEEKWGQSFKFSFVRNPFDKLVSWYFYHRDNLKMEFYYEYTFKQWVLAKCPVHRGIAWGNCTLTALGTHNYLLDLNDNLMVDFLGKIESIEKDFDMLLQKFSYDQCKLVHVNKSNHKNYREYYDSESREEVEKLFKKDLVVFEYQF